MKKYLPFTIVLSVLLIIVAVLEFLALRKNNGIISYPLDDAFIHMAVAKNVAVHHVWGLSPSEWVSSSSSLLYTILLSLCFKIFGVAPWWPLVICAAGSILLLWEMQRELKFTGLSTQRQTFSMLVTMFIAPLPFMTILGMEHTVQMALTLIFTHRCVSRLMDDRYSLADWIIPSLWGFLMVACRYENAYTVLGVCLILAFKRKIFAGGMLGLIAISPVIIFGLYMQSKGGYFLPNSLLLKGKLQVIGLLNDTKSFLELTSVMSGIFVLVVLVLADKFRRKEYDREFWAFIIFTFSATMHSFTAAAGYLYRYEAYLVVLGFFHLSIVFLKWWEPAKIKQTHTWAYAFVFGIFLFNLVPRAVNSFPHAIRCSGNIYDQQYQMALFVKQYYNGSTVAANDVGAISFLGDITMLDLWGLGNNEVAKAKMNKTYNSAYLQNLVTRHNAKVAIIYDKWFEPDLSTHWYKIATWEVPNNYICAEPIVSFYATVPETADGMLTHLKEFESRLPQGVKVEYYYKPGSTNNSNTVLATN